MSAEGRLKILPSIKSLILSISVIVSLIFSI